MTAEVDAREIAAAARAIREGSKGAGKHLEQAGRDTGAVMVANIRAASRRSRRTGRTERQVTATTTGDGDRAVTKVNAGGPVAHLIIGGTSPHTIRPVHGHALPIRSAGGAVRGFAEVVRHPGQRPRPFFAEGVDASLNDEDRNLAAAGEAVLNDVRTAMRRR